MDPSTFSRSTNSRPSAIPRPSRLPVLKSSASQASLRPKPSLDTLKPRPTPSTLNNASSTRPSQTPQFRKPLRPQTATTKTSTRPPPQSPIKRPVSTAKSTTSNPTVNPNGEDTLGHLDGFRSASRASSRAGFRDEEPGISQHSGETGLRNTPKPRQSLAERTVESIAKIPPSPANKRRRSSFFQPDSPITQRTESSTESRSRAGSEEEATIKPIALRPKPALSSRASRPAPAVTGNRSVSVAGSSKPSVNTVKSPTTSKQQPRRPLTASKTVAARPTKSSRQALAGLFNAPNGQSDLADASNPSTPSKSADKTKSPSNPSKSSAALRDQIRAAKASKKSLNGQPAAPAQQSQSEAFDFQLHHDPFGQQPKDGKNVLRQRVDTARSEGRLNIAGMGFKEIPEEVLKIYDYEFNKQQSGISWNEVVDLAKFIAADNDLEAIPEHVFPDVDPNAFSHDDDDSPGPQFGGIDHLDLHGNLLFDLPIGLRRLERLTSLNLSRNRLMNDSLETIAQVPCLKELRMSENALTGELSPSLSNIASLEVLEIQGNKISSLPEEIGQLVHLRILNVSNNQITSLPMDALSKTSLASIFASKNQLSNTLFTETDASMPRLQHLDVSVNSLTSLATSTLSLPALRELNISFNRITHMPDLRTWTALLSLFAQDNSLADMPAGFFALATLKTVDFTGNDFPRLDARIGTMDNLESFNIAANPIRERKFLTMGTAELKRDLKARLGVDEPGKELD